jgi:hypothetical protein
MGSRMSLRVKCHENAIETSVIDLFEFKEPPAPAEMYACTLELHTHTTAFVSEQSTVTQTQTFFAKRACYTT